MKLSKLVIVFSASFLIVSCGHQPCLDNNVCLSQRQADERDANFQIPGRSPRLRNYPNFPSPTNPRQPRINFAVDEVEEDFE